MTDRLKKAYEDVQKASEQIFRGNGGGYHLCYALDGIIEELAELRKLIETRTSKGSEQFTL